MSNSNDRCRNWAFILYPDSSPSNYIDILRSLMVQACISPLHAPTDDLKPHYHVVLLFGSVKSYEQVLSITKLFNGSFPIPVHDIRQYVRYLIHADNPEKEQFSGMEQIQTFGGLDVGKYNHQYGHSYLYNLLKYFACPLSILIIHPNQFFCQ